MSGEPGMEELLVLCSESELQEYGETVRVGEQISREAGRRESGFYGRHLDEIEWQFDQRAQTEGYDPATITSRVLQVYERLRERNWSEQRPELSDSAGCGGNGFGGRAEAVGH